MQQWLTHLDKILAAITAIAALGEWEHWFQIPVVVFLLALATFISEFFKPHLEVVAQKK